MAREGVSLGLEVYCRRDPVSGQQRCFLRRRHDRDRSPRLLSLMACMHQQLQGRHYRTGSAADDASEVRAAFAAATHRCARRP